MSSLFSFPSQCSTQPQEVVSGLSTHSLLDLTCSRAHARRISVIFTSIVRNTQIPAEAQLPIQECGVGISGVDVPISDKSVGMVAPFLLVMMKNQSSRQMVPTDISQASTIDLKKPTAGRAWIQTCDPSVWSQTPNPLHHGVVPKKQRY